MGEPEQRAREEQRRQREAEASRTGFIGVGGYVAATVERPFTLGEIFRQLTDGDARTRLPRILAAREQEGRPLPGPVVAALTDFTSSSENTFASTGGSTSGSLSGAKYAA